MPFSIEWLVPGRVFQLTVAGNIDSEDLAQMGQQVEAWIESGAAPVHMLMDTTQIGRFPVSVTRLNEFSGWLYHPSTGWFILLNPSRLVAFLGTIITGLAHIQYTTAVSREQALQILLKEDPTLSGTA